MSPGLKLLFLCTGNSCRSQMAEAWTRKLYGDLYEVASAGTAPTTIDPKAIQVMAEIGVDLTGQRSKSVNELGNFEQDFVITVCDHARESCPVFPGRARVLHRGFDDPPALRADNPERALDEYRRVRDEIREFVETLPEFLRSEEV